METSSQNIAYPQTNIPQNSAGPLKTPNLTTPPIMPDPPKEEGSNKLIMFLVLGVILIIFAVGGFYLYVNRQQAQSINTTTLNTPAPILPVAKEEDLAKQLNAVNVASDESDFTSVDQDLQNL